MGGPYNIPRNYKGESKILFIFSTKAFLYTIGGAFIGILFYFILSMLGLKTLGLILILILGLIGFVVGTFKIPESSNNDFFRNTGGEQIDDIIMRWIKFKQKKNKIYVYKEEETKDGE